ncbi:S8 family serine peptidase [Catalinimonas alkaloidigena]|uniref:S8 family serine peptidase n=1 Tax=Catalinimonas alkaloidigena TaxID=1075417 RepID=UPI00159FF3CA|nr:S8 family serine peptidase [Catalinimonas alkaloidigena]
MQAQAPAAQNFTQAPVKAAQQKALRQLADVYEAHYQRQQASAQRWATLHAQPLRLQTTQGHVRLLSGFAPNGQPLFQQTENNQASAATIGTTYLLPGGGLQLNLTGQGMRIGQWDGGSVLGTHQELSGRVLQYESGLDVNAHATHVAGTLVASGVQSLARGMAPEAQLRAYDFDNDLSEMASAAADGLLISNHSYGTAAGWDEATNAWYGDPIISEDEDWKFGFYDEKAQAWDQIAHDAPYYLIVKSVGNDRGNAQPASGKYQVWDGSGWVESTRARPKDGGTDGFDCISTYATAKNILTVGAIKALESGYTTPSAVTMSDFSSWGPTDDGRIKPDVVANGVMVYSTNSYSNSAYSYRSGSSMAAPSVAGSLLLVQEYAHRLTGNYLRAATLKALTIHTADEAGPQPGPDYMFGWGVANLRQVATVVGDTSEAHLYTEAQLAQGKTYLLSIESDGTQPLVATLCWTDLPGYPSYPSLNSPELKLINDLDMRITDPEGQVYQPYVLNPAQPQQAATTGDNIRDNVEKIVIPDAMPGVYTLKITHKALLTGSAQPFSLVVSGRKSRNAPPPPTLAASAVTQTTYCLGTELAVAYQTTGTFQNGNSFRLELSDASGSFTSSTLIGSAQGTGGSIRGIIPSYLPAGTGYRLRVVSTAPRLVATGSEEALQLVPSPARPSATSNGPVCTGDVLFLQTDFLENGTYHWQGPNGFESDEQMPVIVNAGLEHGGTYRLSVMTNGCVSEEASVTVQVTSVPVVTLQTDGSTTFCSGESVELSVPAGIGAAYQWYWDGTPLDAATTSSFQATEEGAYSVQVTTEAGCLAFSDTVQVYVKPTPVATLVFQEGVLYASGGSIYRWQRDGQWIEDAADSTYVPMEPGLYAVSIGNETGCSALSTPFAFQQDSTAHTLLYAASVADFTPGLSVGQRAIDQWHNRPERALQAPEETGDPQSAVRLGKGGWLTLMLSDSLANGVGTDLQVVPLDTTLCEENRAQAYVLASQNGTDFVYLGIACGRTDLDLQALPWARYIRLIDTNEGLDADGFTLDGLIGTSGAYRQGALTELQTCGAWDVVKYRSGKDLAGNGLDDSLTVTAHVLDVPDGKTTALGYGGELVVQLETALFNRFGTHPDFEITGPTSTGELDVAVQASIDGSTWHEVGTITAQERWVDLAELPFAMYVRLQDQSQASSAAPYGLLIDGLRCRPHEERTEPDTPLYPPHVYPNPYRAQLTLDYTAVEDEQTLRVQVVDVYGATVWQAEQALELDQHYSLLLPLGTQAPGVYYLITTTERYRQTLKIVKQ